MWDLIVSVHVHCLSFYFVNINKKTGYLFGLFSARFAEIHQMCCFNFTFNKCDIIFFNQP